MFSKESKYFDGLWCYQPKIAMQGSLLAGNVVGWFEKMCARVCLKAGDSGTQQTWVLGRMYQP